MRSRFRWGRSRAKKEVNKFFANKRRGVNKCPTGVSYNADRGKFEAHLSRFGKTLHLGRFDSVDDAVYSYKIGREKFAKELAEKNHTALNEIDKEIK